MQSWLLHLFPLCSAFYINCYLYATLLQLHNSDIEGLKKLLHFAKENNIALTKASSNISTLPGVPFTEKELQDLVTHSRQSGNISAHKVSEEMKRMYGNNTAQIKN